MELYIPPLYVDTQFLLAFGSVTDDAHFHSNGAVRMSITCLPSCTVAHELEFSDLNTEFVTPPLYVDTHFLLAFGSVTDDAHFHSNGEVRISITCLHMSLSFLT